MKSLEVRGSCKTFFDGRVERVKRVDLDSEMFQMARSVAWLANGAEEGGAIASLEKEAPCL